MRQALEAKAVTPSTASVVGGPPCKSGTSPAWSRNIARSIRLRHRRAAPGVRFFVAIKVERASIANDASCGVKGVTGYSPYNGPSCDHRAQIVAGARHNMSFTTTRDVESHDNVRQAETRGQGWHFPSQASA